MLIDTHCHLNHREFDADWEAAIERAVGAGVRAMVVIGYDLASSERAVALARRSSCLWATVGIHPHEAKSVSPTALARLEELAAEPRVVGLGEIGLDFYRDLSPRDAQERAFRAQLELATTLRLPVVIHTRDSTAATLDVLEEFSATGLRGVLHCWSGTEAEAERATGAGWWLGIGGVVTFKNAAELHAVVRSAPLNRLLLETDSPYLAPQPRRGKRNEPAFLPWIADRVAELRGVAVEEIAAQTTANTIAAFPRLRIGEDVWW